MKGPVSFKLAQEVMLSFLMFVAFRILTVDPDMDFESSLAIRVNVLFDASSSVFITLGV